MAEPERPAAAQHSASSQPVLGSLGEFDYRTDGQKRQLVRRGCKRCRLVQMTKVRNAARRRARLLTHAHHHHKHGYHVLCGGAHASTVVSTGSGLGTRLILIMLPP